MADLAKSRGLWMVRAAYLIACHIGWFVSVLSAAKHIPWIGAVFSAAMVLYHLRTAPRWRDEAKLVMVTVLCAAVWESCLVKAGVIVYFDGTLMPGTTAYWILGLWAQLAIQTNVLLSWFKTRLLLAAITGAAAGPLSFRAGVALGAAHFPDPWLSTLVLALGWALLFPGLIVLGRHWNGMRESRRTPEG